jgi:hypothetical protein
MLNRKGYTLKMLTEEGDLENVKHETVYFESVEQETWTLAMVKRKGRR